MCAAWELYSEEVLLESVGFMLSKVDHPDNLPKQCRKTLAMSAKADINELAVLKLAGGGWKDYYLSIAAAKIASLNTPNASNLISLFKELLGIDLSTLFDPLDETIRFFIRKRGDIAHQGAKAGHISIKNLELDYDFICKLASDLDNQLIDALKSITGNRPWNKK